MYLHGLSIVGYWCSCINKKQITFAESFRLTLQLNLFLNFQADLSDRQIRLNSLIPTVIWKIVRKIFLQVLINLFCKLYDEIKQRCNA